MEVLNDLPLQQERGPLQQSSRLWRTAWSTNLSRYSLISNTMWTLLDTIKDVITVCH